MRQNPSTQHSAELKPAIQLLQAVKAREDRISELLAELQELLESATVTSPHLTWAVRSLGDALEVQNGFAFDSSLFTQQGASR